MQKILSDCKSVNIKHFVLLIWRQNESPVFGPHCSISVTRWDRNCAVQVETNHTVACQIKPRIPDLNNRRDQSNVVIAF